MAHGEVAALIQTFDVALAPYPRPDHVFYFSPLKLFEYMACGVPVVATNLGQISEVVRDGETGLLCPPGDHEALVAACERLLEDPDLRSRLGKAAAKEITPATPGTETPPAWSRSPKPSSRSDGSE